MDFIKNPRAIEEKSMDLIDPFISDIDLTPEEVTVYSRMIHASGDVDYGHLIRTSEGAVEAVAGILNHLSAVSISCFHTSKPSPAAATSTAT